MTNIRSIDEVGKSAYGVKVTSLPPMGRPAPIDIHRQRGKTNRAKGLYMLETKTLNGWRKLRGHTHDELGELTGVGASIEHYLYGGGVPRVDVATTFAKVLGVQVDQIIWGKVEKVDIADLPPMPKVPAHDPKVRVSLVTDEQLKIADQWLQAGQTKTAVAKAMGVSRETLYKALERLSQMKGAEKPKKEAAKQASEAKPAKVKRGASKDVL